MLKYVSLMVHAYCNVTGKSEEEALRDLAIDGFVSAGDLEKNFSKDLLAMIPTDATGVLAWKKEIATRGGTMQEKKMVTIANIVANCAYCQPLTGCILSDLKGKTREEIIGSLRVLSGDFLNRILSFHESCPYQEKVGI